MTALGQQQSLRLTPGRLLTVKSEQRLLDALSTTTNLVLKRLPRAEQLDRCHREARFRDSCLRRAGQNQDFGNRQ